MSFTKIQLGLFLFTVSFGTMGVVRDLYAQDSTLASIPSATAHENDAPKLSVEEQAKASGFTPVRFHFYPSHGKDQGCFLMGAFEGNPESKSKDSRSDWLAFDCAGEKSGEREISYTKSNQGRNWVHNLIAASNDPKGAQPEFKDRSFGSKVNHLPGTLIDGLTGGLRKTGTTVRAETLTAAHSQAVTSVGTKAGEAKAATVNGLQTFGTGMASLGCDATHYTKVGVVAAAKGIGRAGKATGGFLFRHLFRRNHNKLPACAAGAKPTDADVPNIGQDDEGGDCEIAKLKNQTTPTPNAWCEKMHEGGGDSGSTGETTTPPDPVEPNPALATRETAKPAEATAITRMREIVKLLPRVCPANTAEQIPGTGLGSMKEKNADVDCRIETKGAGVDPLAIAYTTE